MAFGCQNMSGQFNEHNKKLLWAFVGYFSPDKEILFNKEILFKKERVLVSGTTLSIYSTYRHHTSCKAL
jgi:hypothetical protein